MLNCDLLCRVYGLLFVLYCVFVCVCFSCVCFVCLYVSCDGLCDAVQCVVEWLIVFVFFLMC